MGGSGGCEGRCLPWQLVSTRLLAAECPHPLFPRQSLGGITPGFSMSLQPLCPPVSSLPSDGTVLRLPARQSLPRSGKLDGSPWGGPRAPAFSKPLQLRIPVQAPRRVLQKT